MAVIQGTVWAPQPGRAVEMVGQMAVAKKIHARLGAKVRAWQIVVGGANSLQAIYALEYADWNAFGKVNQALNGDAEWQGFVQTVLNAPNPSASLVSNNLATTIPGMEGSAAAGSGPGPRIRTARVFQVQPGRQVEARALLAELKVQVERCGGNFRASAGVFTGPAVGQLRLTSEFADVVAFGSFQARTTDDAAFQAFIANRILAAGAPITLVSAVTQSELPI
jgi:hypothetical protein